MMCHRSDTVRMLGEKILAKLLYRKEVKRASFTGVLRRRKEIVSQIDLLVSSDSPEALITAFPDILDFSVSITAEGNPTTSQQGDRYTYNCTLVGGIVLRLNLVPDDAFPLLLLQLTGSDAFLKQLANRAAQYGIKISAYGLFLDDHLLPCKEEKDIFSMLGLDFIPPELR